MNNSISGWGALLAYLMCLAAGPGFPQPFTPSDLSMPSASQGMAQWGDYDRDGRYDFVITGQTPGLNVWHNDGGGNFSAQGLSLVLRQSQSVAWGDWDNDNDLDLVVGGADTGGYPVQNVYSLTRFYRNDGTNFTLVGDGIPFVGQPTLVDMDRDGDQDLVLVGVPPNNVILRSIRIYSNEGSGNFNLAVDFPLPVNIFGVCVTDVNSDGWPDVIYVEVRDEGALVTTLLNQSNYQFSSNAVLYAMGPGQLLVGDLDNDGDEDFGMIGYDNGPGASASGWVRNDGGVGTFLPGIVYQMGNSANSLVDYNNDGRLDVAMVGWIGSWDNQFRFWRNDGAFAFTQVDPGIDGTQFAVMAWGDYDGDGDLDLLLSGIPNGSPGTNFIRLYRNNCSVTNPPPLTPGNLVSAVTGSGVQLAWSAASDPNQSGGLSYNVRVGRTSGGVDIVTPMANLVSGQGLLPQKGNAGLTTFMPLTNLLAGHYFWSVQARDNAFASSAFASEGEFDIPPGLPRAGQVTVSDVRYPRVTLNAAAIPNGAPALAWFEYGVSTTYGSIAPATALGSGTLPVWITNEITGLLTATNYHCRLVVSNGVGLSSSLDALFFISNNLPTLESLPTLVIMFPNRPSAVLNFTVGDVETAADSLSVTGKASNATLLPVTGFQFGGAGSNRTLVLIPAAEQRGMTRITLTVTDEHGGQKSRTATVRVEDFTQIWSTLAGSGDAVLADVDRDGFLDVIRTDRWLRNPGGTNLVQPSNNSINALGTPVLSELDNDGDIDLIATGSKLTRIWTNGPWAGGPARYQDAAVTNLTGYNIGWAILCADFNQDGRGDVLMAGFTNSPTANSYATRAFFNQGALVFSAVTNLLPDIADAALACADFDRDGDMDLCIAGTTNTQSGFYTALFSNDGGGHFTEVPSGLPMFSKALLLPGDFDNDGWPDLLISGSITVGNQVTNLCKIFRNNHDGTFADDATLLPLTSPKAVLTDLDSDGWLDVVLLGSPPVQPFPTTVTRMYLNKGGGQFVDIGTALVDPSLTSSSVAAGDLTQDGRPDLVLVPYVARNNFPNSNSPPEPPSGLNAVPAGDSVALSWSAAFDSNQSGGLTYNLRVGTCPGGIDVMSPAAEVLTGKRWVVGPGNASESLQWRLRGLRPGVYFWSVQAIDHAGAGSVFATEQSFTIADPRPRILSVRLENGTVTLQTQFSCPGFYSVLTSPDLDTWTELPAAAYQIGITNITVSPGTIQCQYFRLRNSP